MVSQSTRETDAELVLRTVQGDLSAFDALVLRHRQAALQTAVSQLGDWDLAEDVTQQAMLEAYRGLKGLQHGAKFRPWLLTIVRRVAIRRRQLQPPMPLEFSEAVIYPLYEAIPARDELAERVRASLEELSARHRQVVTLHYLDGYSCREIGVRLALPTGTVKRILHESRASLRTSQELPQATERLKGVLKMKGTGPRDIDWWVNGSIDGQSLGLGRALTRAVCLSVNKTPKSIADISNEVDAHPRYVLETLRPLIDEELVKQLPEERFLADYIAMEAKEWMTWVETARAHSMRFADALQTHLPALEAAWNLTSLPAKGFSWEIGIWPTLAIFICNIGLIRHSPVQPAKPDHPSGHHYWFGAHEKVTAENDIWVAGFNLTGEGGDYLHYGHWWSPGINRHPSGFSNDQNRVLDSVARGVDNVDRIAAAIGESVERTREILARQLEIGLLSRQDGMLTNAFPVITLADNDYLFPAVDATVSQLTNDLLLPWTTAVDDRLRNMGYGHLEAQFPVWRLWLAGNIANEGLRTLVSRGILPVPGDPAPANFCFIGWYDKPSRPRVLDWEGK